MMTILLEGSRANAAVSEPQQAISITVYAECHMAWPWYQLLREGDRTLRRLGFTERSRRCVWLGQKSGGSCQNFHLPDEPVGHDAVSHPSFEMIQV